VLSSAKKNWSIFAAFVEIKKSKMTTALPKRRIMMDIKQLESDETKSLRIFYNSDETNMCNGTALIFGPEGTIYEDLPILLEIQFPPDYPFTNPKVKFITCDSRTRFHPNLYINGKVCLSILGTWQGPSWTSVMTLRTVLLSIIGLLDNEPLLHEPGHSSSKGTQKSKDYSSFVEHSVLHYIVGTIEQYSKKNMDPSLKLFEEELEKELPNIYKRTLTRLEKLAVEPKKVWNQVPYNMSGTSIYSELLDRFKKVPVPTPKID
jgi:ubiquitin-protein ligase